MTHSAPHPTSPSTSRTARLVTRRARWVLALGGLAVVLAAIVGAGALGKLKGGGFDDPSSPSSRGQQVLEHRFGVDSANLLLLVSAHPGGTVDSPAVVAAGRVVTAKLAAEPGVRVLTTYWSPGGGPTLRSRDATRALVVAHVAGSQDDADKARPGHRLRRHRQRPRRGGARAAPAYPCLRP
jgi:RND superfamily putative drug exporter